MKDWYMTNEDTFETGLDTQSCYVIQKHGNVI